MGEDNEIHYLLYLPGHLEYKQKDERHKGKHILKAREKTKENYKYISLLPVRVIEGP